MDKARSFTELLLCDSDDDNTTAKQTETPTPQASTPAIVEGGSTVKGESSTDADPLPSDSTTETVRIAFDNNDSGNSDAAALDVQPKLEGSSSAHALAPKPEPQPEVRETRRNLRENKLCPGEHNMSVTWGISLHQGIRNAMEDTVAIVPAFMMLTCGQFGGCTAPDSICAQKKSPIHYFGIFHGHGGDQVSKLCANELHYMIKEDWMMVSGDNGWRKRWEVAICRAFERIDARLKDKSLASYSVGSTASLVILSSCQIIAAHVGNSRVVLSCDKDAVQLTSDHRLDREDEVARIINGGGRVINWGCPLVEGVLSVTRAIGDHSLKPWIISVPEITFSTRSKLDKFLVLGTDGVWAKMNNEKVISCVRSELTKRKKQLKIVTRTLHSPASFAAKRIVKGALDAHTCDNTSLIVVDLVKLKIEHMDCEQKRRKLSLRHASV